MPASQIKVWYRKKLHSTYDIYTNIVTIINWILSEERAPEEGRSFVSKFGRYTEKMNEFRHITGI
jgi:hypothetical protein